jgi:hypothetical protein
METDQKVAFAAIGFVIIVIIALAVIFLVIPNVHLPEPPIKPIPAGYVQYPARIIK